MYHGIAFDLLEAISNPYNDLDYSRFKKWGLNSVIYVTWWSHLLESDEFSPGVYNEEVIDKLNEQINLAKKYGLKPVFSARVCYDQNDPKPWHGWSEPLGANYVNLNLPDASGMGGRTRFSNFLCMIASRFPNLAICPWYFPFHKQEATTDERRILHEETLPFLYYNLRKVTKSPIILNPIHQGQSGDWQTGLSNGFYEIEAESYGWPFTQDVNLIYGFSNHSKESNYTVCCECLPWDYNYNRLYEHYNPLIYFKNKHDVKFCCVESLSMKIHSDCGERPINKSRIDWAKTQMELMKKLGLNWFYYRYENPPKGQSPMDLDGSDNEVALLISEYSPVPLFTLKDLFNIGLPTVIGITLFYKTKYQ